MRRGPLFGVILVTLFAFAMVLKPVSADTLQPDDFKLQSFSKTVDFFDFARAYAASHGKSPPPTNSHAYLYQVYINVSGFQLYFSGLSNITGEHGALTIPVQSFIEHYRTAGGKDVLTSSSFIMLLAFNETASSLYPDSPDKNDVLYASFSLGVDLSSILGNHSKPSLSSKTSIIPLTSSADKLSWEWGMRYANLTAVWWRMFTEPQNPRFDVFPVAITTYQELTFTYKLTMSPSDHTAKVTVSYVIGRMTNLWLFQRIFLFPVVVHLNSTGAYRVGGAKISDETIYQFLDKQRIKMSIVQFQNSLVLDGTTKSSYNNQNVTDAEVDVSNGAISTAAGNEEIFRTTFGTKKQYNLFNYTADHREATYKTYDSVTRTVPRAGFAKNPLFSTHVALLKYVPLIVANIDPPLYQKAKDHILNMSYADYLCITSYPKYSGFKVQHDPTYTAYIAATAASATQPSIPFGLLVVGGAVVAMIVGAVLFMGRRSLRTNPSNR